MRILHAIPALGYGGAERIVVSLACGQQRAGHEVAVLTQQARSSERDTLLREGVRVFELGGTSRSGLMMKSAAWLARSRKHLAGIDVLHGHLTYGSAFGALARLVPAAIFAETPIHVETDHAAGMQVSTKTRLVYTATSWNADAIVSVIRGATTTRRTFKRTVRSTIPNGIKPLPIRSSWQVGGPLRLGSLGLLRSDRRPEMYLDLMREVSHLGDANFTFGGDGPLLKKMERRARAMGLSESVKFAGMIDDKEEFFSGLDVHVSIAVGDDVGLATLEAASTATPSFTQQISTGKRWSATAIPTRESAHDLAKVIWELAANSRDRRVLGNRQAAYVRSDRSIDQMVASYDAVYRACLQARAGR